VKVVACISAATKQSGLLEVPCRAAARIRLARGRPGTVKLLLLVLSDEILNPTALVKGMMASAERARRDGVVRSGRATVDRCSNLSSPVLEALTLVIVPSKGSSSRALVRFLCFESFRFSEGSELSACEDNEH
jgi:hypothetical protein